MDYESFLELVKKRRSIRRFRPEPIPDEYVDKIIEAARWAPSGGNSQPWEFIVVRKQELKDNIIRIIREQKVLDYKMELVREPGQRFYRQAKPPERFGYEDAPVFIILCGDIRTKDAYPISAAADPLRAQSIFNSSLANVFLYMHLAATTLGLGSQWVSASCYHFVQCLIKDMLGIPQELQVYDMMAVGYPALQVGPRLLRPKEEMIHSDHYDQTKFRTGAEVRDFITTLRS